MVGLDKFFLNGRFDKRTKIVGTSCRRTQAIYFLNRRNGRKKSCGREKRNSYYRSA